MWNRISDCQLIILPPLPGVPVHCAEERIQFNSSVAKWCLRKAARCTRRRQTEEALQWLLLSARVMACECATLVSPHLEKQLIGIGLGLAMPGREVPPPDSCKRWLHVLTEVRGDGGHSAMLKRWIQLDPENNVHNIALLSQTVPVPALLSNSVRSRNGEIHQIDHKESLIARSSWLREIVTTHADVVVLHTHPWDIIPTVALALPGGPPVLLVNHAAHIFWVGASVADVVLNCRISPQEDEWTIRHRGVPSVMHLPIPLPEPRRSGTREAEESRSTVRRSLAISQDALVMMSVGIGNKYTPIDGVDFAQVMGTILEADKRVNLMVVGPEKDPRWEKLRERSAGRFILVEKQPDVAMPALFQAADIYLEGFPFGSTTALLEAALGGLPCVLPPASCAPPFTTDGIALELLERPADVPAYRQRIHLLLNDPEERVQCGRMLSESIRSQHCGPGWSRYLAAIQANLPGVHRVRPLGEQENVESNLSAYWTSFSAMVNEDPLVSTFRTAGYLGLVPKIDWILFLRLLRYGERGRKPGGPSTFTLAQECCVSYLISMTRVFCKLIVAGRHGVRTFFQGTGEKCPTEK